MSTLVLIILATGLLSILSLVGALTLVLKDGFLKKATIYLVAFSAGAFIGNAFLHLIPEAINEINDTMTVMVWVIAGFVMFLIFEQFINWHHCHKMPDEHKHPVTYMILFTDSLHNFLDGLTIGVAFLVNPLLGWTTALAIAAHELPQELGDFGILIHGGWKKSKALLFNLFSGLTAVLGGVAAWALASELNIVYLLPFAAGNFIYIAAADLIPEFKHCENAKRNFNNFIAFMLGLALMFGIQFIGDDHSHGHGGDHDEAEYHLDLDDHHDEESHKEDDHSDRDHDEEYHNYEDEDYILDTH